MTAKEYLSQYRDMVKDVRAKRDELKKLREDATAISPQTSEGGHTPGAVSDKVGRKAAAAADIEREIEEECAACRLLRRDIRATIAQVSSGDLRRLLSYRYICGCTWERVAVKMGYSYVHVVHRLHPRALQAVGDIVWGKDEIECNAESVV